MFCYSLGAGVPMLIIAYGGNYIVQKLNFFKKQGQNIQKAAGVLLLIGIILIATGLDTKIQTSLFDIFPKLGMVEQSLLDSSKAPSTTTQPSTQTTVNSDNKVTLLPKTQKAPELVGTGSWVNSEPLTLSSLKGKVVIVDFWTYSCINCLRTLPYIKKWDEKYRDQGLVIIGVHTPEFAFEKELANLQKAVSDNGLKYPIVQDNDYATWTAYDNHYWPAKYIIDADGYVRYTHFGEGEYDTTEQVIQELLKEKNPDAKVSSTEIEKDNSDKMLEMIKSPETYLGSDRNEYQTNPEKSEAGKTITFTKPQSNNSNSFYLEGEWYVDNQFIKPVKNASLTINYTANKVNLVMDSKDKDGKQIPSTVSLQLNGRALKSNELGKDADKSGIVKIDSARLYNLVDTGEEASEKTLTITFPSSNTQAFAFTFG